MGKIAQATDNKDGTATLILTKTVSGQDVISDAFIGAPEDLDIGIAVRIAQIADPNRSKQQIAELQQSLDELQAKRKAVQDALQGIEIVTGGLVLGG